MMREKEKTRTHRIDESKLGRPDRTNKGTHIMFWIASHSLAMTIQWYLDFERAAEIRDELLSVRKKK
jgi:protein-arginine kinase activator protein McsA